jgi:hypothetical protein
MHNGADKCFVIGVMDPRIEEALYIEVVNGEGFLFYFFIRKHRKGGALYLLLTIESKRILR